MIKAFIIQIAVDEPIPLQPSQFEEEIRADHSGVRIGAVGFHIRGGEEVDRRGGGEQS